MREFPTFAPSRFFNPMAALPPELRPVVKKRRPWRRRKTTKAKRTPKPHKQNSRRSS